MIPTEELTGLLDVIDKEEGQNRVINVSLGDGEALFAVAEGLRALAVHQSGANQIGDPADQLAGWLDDYLNTAWTVGDENLYQTSEALFAPFLRPADIFLLANGGNPQLSIQRSYDINTTKTYLQAVIAAWGTPIQQAVAATQPVLVRQEAADHRVSPAVIERLMREMVITCGLCSVPISSLAYTVPAELAYRLVSALAQCVEQTRQRLFQGPRERTEVVQWRLPDVALVVGMLDSLLKRKMAQIQAVAEMIPTQPNVRMPIVDRADADRYAGAFIEGRAICIEIGEKLAKTYVAIHRFTSPASTVGITDPLIIDPTESMKVLRELQPLVHVWISAAMQQAAQQPGDLDTLNRQLDRVALALGGMQALLSLVEILDRLGDLEEIGPFLDPTVRHLQALTVNLRVSLPLLLVDWDKEGSAEKIRTSIETTVDDAQTILTSLRWSAMVGQAMQNATEIILAIETGGQMGGIANSLRSGPATAGVLAGRSAVMGVLTERDIMLISQGAMIMAMASNPKAGRKKGIRAERGLGLSPNRPRTEIESLTGTSTARIPDNIPKGFRSFWEVKNVARLRMTWQLSDFFLYAQATGRKMVLYIRPRVGKKAATVISPSVRTAINVLRKEGLIEVRFLKIF